MGLFDTLFGDGRSSEDMGVSASNRARRQWNPGRRPVYDWEETDPNGIPLSMKKVSKELDGEGLKKVEEDTRMKSLNDAPRLDVKRKRSILDVLRYGK